MPEVMDLDGPDLVALADAPQTKDQHARLDQPSSPDGEHQVSVEPG
jgi:hypothetical protein